MASMKSNSQIWVMIAVFVLLAACATTQSTTYPVEITGVGESENFPLNAAGYERGKMLMYEPGMKNHSVGYNLAESSLENAVTLYFYVESASLEEQFQREVDAVLEHDPNAELLETNTFTLEKEGKEYEARAATFRKRGEFRNEEQELFSELLLVAQPERFFKVRSTAPFVQADAAASRSRELLQAVNWAY